MNTVDAVLQVRRLRVEQQSLQVEIDRLNYWLMGGGRLLSRTRFFIEEQLSAHQ